MHSQQSRDHKEEKRKKRNEYSPEITREGEKSAAFAAVTQRKIAI